MTWQDPSTDLENVNAAYRAQFERANAAEAERDDLMRRYTWAVNERDRWIRSFNRLEKAVTNHIGRDCIDSEGLAHAHRAVLSAIGPQPLASPRTQAHEDDRKGDER